MYGAWGSCSTNFWWAVLLLKLKVTLQRIAAFLGWISASLGEWPRMLKISSVGFLSRTQRNECLLGVSLHTHGSCAKNSAAKQSYILPSAATYIACVLHERGMDRSIIPSKGQHNRTWPARGSCDQSAHSKVATDFYKQFLFYPNYCTTRFLFVHVHIAMLPWLGICSHLITNSTKSKLEDWKVK